MARFVRGSSINFVAKCLNKDGNPVTPTDAELHLSYANGADYITMTIAGHIVSATWDSSPAVDSMPVAWHIRAWNAVDKVAQDGTFTLSAAEANPAK